MERRSLTASVLVHLAALLLLVVILAPVVWLFVMSISSTPDLIAKPLHWWPDTVDLSRYGVLLSSVANSAGEAFVASLFNSIKVAGMATVAALIVAVPSAWAVSRTPSVGWSLYAVIATYMLPPVALGRTALHDAGLGRPPQQCLRSGTSLPYHPSPVHHMVDEIGLRFDPARD